MLPRSSFMIAKSSNRSNRPSRSNRALTPALSRKRARAKERPHPNVLNRELEAVERLERFEQSFIRSGSRRVSSKYSRLPRGAFRIDAAMLPASSPDTSRGGEPWLLFHSVKKAWCFAHRLESSAELGDQRRGSPGRDGHHTRQRIAADQCLLRFPRGSLRHLRP